MTITLKNKTALVCGSTQGIGLATAKLLAELGAKVILLARNELRLKESIPLLSNAGRHEYLVADFSKPEELEKVLKEYSGIDQIDILINNTGGPAAGPIVEAKPQMFLSTFNQHLICNHILMQAVVGGMKKRNWGRIINVISTSVKAPLPGLGVSNTIRGAVANWSKTLAGELGKDNITVNNVLPGATSTERLTGIISNKALKTGHSEKEITTEMLEEIPMQRFAQPEETAKAIVFLASDWASYINGINLPVDGGRTKNL